MQINLSIKGVPAAGELRQRYPVPNADIPRGTDLIREDRDSR